MKPILPLLRENTISSDLPLPELQRLSDSSEPTMLAQGAHLYEAGHNIDYVYFPVDCLLMQFASVDQDLMLAVGMSGRQDLLGGQLWLGARRSLVRAVVQKGGAAARVPAASYLRILSKSPVLQRATAHQAGRVLQQAVQAAVCSRYHALDARLARTLLSVQDRLATPSFHMTQEFLAQALGVRRVGVTKAATAFAQAGLIAYSRGDITILDRAGLVQHACSCYADAPPQEADRLV